MTVGTQRRALMLLAVTLAATACTVWSAKDPRLVSGSVPPEYQPWPDYETTHKIMVEHLSQQIGNDFPDLTLVSRRNQVTRLSTLRGHRVAVLSAIAACPHSVAWLKELRSQGWQPPSGFDALVVLVNAGGTEEWNSLVRACPQAHLVGWPLEQYLEYVRFYPVMFAVSPKGKFEGWWQKDEEPPAPSASVAQPNNALNPPHSSVTALAQGGKRRAAGRAG